MKTTITLTVDGDMKEKAMKIIKIKFRTTLSHLVNKMLIDIVKDNYKK